MTHLFLWLGRMGILRKWVPDNRVAMGVRSLLGLWLIWPALAVASWPDRPVRIIVPYVAGSLGDNLARSIAEGLRDRLGPVIVENRAGAGGNVGMQAAAQAAADGYTFVLAPTNNFVINQFLFKNLRLDPTKALEPVTILVEVPTVIFINSQARASTLPEFVAFARAQKGKLNYGSSGVGTMLHLTGELVSRNFGLDMAHVPFKGSPEAVTALLANEVQMYVVGAAVGLPHVKSGRFKALATSGSERSPLLPDVPTFTEAGIGGLRAGNWWGLAAPKGTPREVIDRMHEQIKTVAEQPAFAARLRELGMSPVFSSPPSATRRIEEEARFWQGALKEMAVSLD
jgi:tripartite-type tricarboxylate transporter receptor subunit TctC